LIEWLQLFVFMLARSDEYESRANQCQAPSLGQMLSREALNEISRRKAGAFILAVLLPAT
jgi:hypothetical protein